MALIRQGLATFGRLLIESLRRVLRIGIKGTVMVKWFTVAPIFDYAGSEGAMGDGIDFFNDVRIERLPDWIDESDIESLLNWLQRVRLERSVWAFVSTQESTDTNSDLQERSERCIWLANLACWLAHPSGIKYELIMHFRKETGKRGVRERARYLLPFVPLDGEQNFKLTAEDHETATSLHEVMCGVKSRVILTALTNLSYALTTRDFDVRFLQTWVAVEALFGPDSPGETIHQIAERSALFLGQTRQGAKKLYATVKRLYTVRSRVAHGRFTSKPGEDAQSLCRELESLLRLSLNRILLDRETLRLFTGKKRDEYLKELVFNGLPDQ